MTPSRIRPRAAFWGVIPWAQHCLPRQSGRFKTSESTAKTPLPWKNGGGFQQRQTVFEGLLLGYLGASGD